MSAQCAVCGALNGHEFWCHFPGYKMPPETEADYWRERFVKAAEANARLHNHLKELIETAKVVLAESARDPLYAEAFAIACDDMGEKVEQIERLSPLTWQPKTGGEL